MGLTTFTPRKTKKCPFCTEPIQAAAVKCRYCAEFLNTDEAKALEAAAEQGLQPSDKIQAEKILFKARPSLWGIAGSALKGLFFLALAVVLMTIPLENPVNNLLKLDLTDNQAIAFAGYRQIAGIILAGLVILGLLIKVVRLKMIYYEVTPSRIEWSRGILDRRVDNLDMFRVIDLRLRRSLLDCMVGIGTVTLITTDKTDPEFDFEKIRRPRKLYDIIREASLEADRKNSVFHLE